MGISHEFSYLMGSQILFFFFLNDCRTFKMIFLSLNALSSIQKAQILSIWIYTLDYFQDLVKMLQIKIMFSDHLICWKNFTEGFQLSFEYCFWTLFDVTELQKDWIIQSGRDCCPAYCSKQVQLWDHQAAHTRNFPP